MPLRLSQPPAPHRPQPLPLRTHLTRKPNRAAEEAAGSEEMSKIMAEYDEQQEAHTQNNEIIEVKVIAYTEHGVVVDLGQKNEGLIPAAEFSETEIPRPGPERND